MLNLNFQENEKMRKFVALTCMAKYIKLTKTLRGSITSLFIITTKI